MKKKETDVCLKYINLIEAHYALSRKTLKVYVTPRDCWEIRQGLEITAWVFKDLISLETGYINHFWWRGAKFIRKEVE